MLAPARNSIEYIDQVSAGSQWDPRAVAINKNNRFGRNWPNRL
jgi:hypothetical protein